MAKSKSDLSKEISEKQAQLRQILLDNKIQIPFQIERYNPNLKPNFHDDEELIKEHIAQEFYDNLTKNMSDEDKDKLIPFYRKKISYGGKADINNLVLIPKDLFNFLDVVLRDFTSGEYAPHLTKRFSLITDDYSYLQNGTLYLKQKEERQIFLDKILTNTKSFCHLKTGLENHELEALQNGEVLSSLRIIKIDYYKDFTADNLLLTRRSKSNLIIETMENCNSGFIDKLREDQVFLRTPYATRPPPSSFLMRLMATFAPEKLEEIGITKEQAAEIALTKSKKRDEKGFFKKYTHAPTDKIIKLKNAMSSNIVDLAKEDAELLVELLMNDPRYTKMIEIVSPLNEEDAHRATKKYTNIIPYFLKMCAIRKEEVEKLKTLGLSDIEITMMKHGYRFTRALESGVKARKAKPDIARLTIHHIIPRSFGKAILDLSQDIEEGGRIVRVPPDRKSNLILIHDTLHNAIHRKYEQQTNGLRKIIDFSKFGYVMDHVSLMEEYGLTPQEQRPSLKPKSKQFTPIWQLIDNTTTKTK